MTGKVAILLFSTFLLAFAAAFQIGIAYAPRAQTDPAWYHSKACFYIFNFAFEVIILYLYAGLRVDQRFHIPDKDKLDRKTPDGYGYIPGMEKFTSEVLSDTTLLP